MPDAGFAICRRYFRYAACHAYATLPRVSMLPRYCYTYSARRCRRFSRTPAHTRRQLDFRALMAAGATHTDDAAAAVYCCRFTITQRYAAYDFAAAAMMRATIRLCHAMPPLRRRHAAMLICMRA